MPVPLQWQPATKDELDRLGSEGMPLLDYLLTETGAPPPDTACAEAQRTALRTLIDAAFEP